MRSVALAVSVSLLAAVPPGRVVAADASRSAPAATRQSPSSAQEPAVAAAIAPDTVRVGDVFRAALRVDLPPGYRVEFPDSLAVGEPIEPAGRPRESAETLPDGRRRVTAVYPLSAWRPGAATLPTVAVRLVGPDGERTVEARLPRLMVRSVLPPDTTGLRPRGLKDVLGASRTWWPLFMALLVGAVAVGGLVYWWRRAARPVPVPIGPPIPPRERALAALDRARASGLVEAGRYKPFYSLVTAAVRLYLDEVNRDWGAELTTTELVERAERGMDPEAAAALARLLASADLVKFARRRPTPEEAFEDWAAARAWVQAHGAPPEPDSTAGHPVAQDAAAGDEEVA